MSSLRDNWVSTRQQKRGAGLHAPRFFPGETYQRAFDKPGTYPYRCGPHPEMLGVIEVAE